MDVIGCINKNDYIRIDLTIEQRTELESIYNLLMSYDPESIILAFGIFKSLFPTNAYFLCNFFGLDKLRHINDIVYHDISSPLCGRFIIGESILRSIILDLLTIRPYYYKYEKNTTK